MNKGIIGDVGENAFDSVCRTAGLECSSMSRDRTGKDRIVEWPIEGADSNTPLDKRPLGRRAHIQLKSTANPDGSIYLKLSSLDFLVFDQTPAFIVSPLVSPSGLVQDYYFWHVRDSLMARILKRLREVTRDNKKANKLHLSLKLSTGTRLPADPQKVRDWMEQQIGSDINQYSIKKNSELTSLGYGSGEGGGSISVSIEAISKEKLIEGLLGKARLPAFVKSSDERRFGIPLPSEKIAPGSEIEILISSNSPETVAIEISRENTASVSFDASVYTPMAKIGNAMIFEFRANPIEIRLQVDGTHTQWSFRFDPETALHMPQDLDLLAKKIVAMDILRSGNAKITFHRANEEPLAMNISDPTNAVSMPTEIQDIRSICEDVLSIWSAAGLDPRPFILSSLDVPQFDRLALGAVNRPINRVVLQLPENTDLLPGVDETDVYFLLYLVLGTIGDEYFAAASRMSAKPTVDSPAKLELLSSSVLDVRRISKTDLQVKWDAFVAKHQSQYPSDTPITFGIPDEIDNK